jgi:HEPN domain-containing protein
MRTNSFRTLFAACALSLFAAGAWAHDQPAPVLNALELRQMVERGEPSDHARLAAHFAAVAERYAAEANQHERMAQAGTGQPAKSSNAGLAAHCRSLAKADRELEEGARALATFHSGRAAGASVAPPANTRGLERGVGTATPKEKDLAEYAAKAAEANDHRALADYFTTLADRYSADADGHRAMSAWYGSNSRLAGMVPHCDRLTKTASAAAKESRAAAAMHKQMLGTAR